MPLFALEGSLQHLSAPTQSTAALDFSPSCFNPAFNQDLLLVFDASKAQGRCSAGTVLNAGSKARCSQHCSQQEHKTPAARATKPQPQPQDPHFPLLSPSTSVQQSTASKQPQHEPSTPQPADTSSRGPPLWVPHSSQPQPVSLQRWRKTWETRGFSFSDI